MAQQLKAEERLESTKSALKSLRAGGRIPGSVYGKKMGSHSISINEKELLNLIRHHRHAIVEMEVAGVGKHPVMINEIQRDPLYQNITHVDFHQIDMNQEIRTNVRIHLVGEAQGAKEGGIMQIVLHEAEIRCMPDRIPETLELDVSGLELGESLFAQDIKLPAGVELATHPDEVVVSILTVQKEEEPVSEAAAPAAKEQGEPVAEEAGSAAE